MWDVWKILFMEIGLPWATSTNEIILKRKLLLKTIRLASWEQYKQARNETNNADQISQTSVFFA